MKTMLKYNARLKNIAIPLALFTLLAMVIWYGSPLLVITQRAPFQDPQKRLALIAALVLGWLLKFLFWDDIKMPPSHARNLVQMLHALRGRFLGAIRFLKKTIIDKHGYSTPLNKLPWYLFIGPPGAGKTTLLAHSNMNYILSKQYRQEGQDKEISASSVCDWWVTRDLVLVDVPGCYIFSPAQDAALENGEAKENNTAEKPILYLGLWKALLSLLTRYRQKNNIGAIIIALQLPELLKQSRQQQTLWFQEMKERLMESWNKLGKLPLYFIITKCDLMPGFSEFFNDAGSDELAQPWGIPLSSRKEHETLPDAFTQRFNALIKRLNKQLIWRLHLERNPDCRPLIKDFPLQLEYLKETLGHLIKMLLAVNPSLDIEGVYLTSALQENPASGTSTLFHHDLPAEIQTPFSSPFISRAYFVKHFISYILPQTSHHLIQRLRQRNLPFSRLVYSLGFVIVLLCALWFGKDFQQGLYKISNIQRYLSQYQLYVAQHHTKDSSIISLNTALPLLNSLLTAAQPETYSSRLQEIESYYSQKSQRTIIAIYDKALQTILMPKIKTEFEKYLQSADDKNPAQLYEALKAYLMLRQQDSKLSNKARVDFILQTLQEISPLLKKNSLNKDLVLHIQNALQMKLAGALDKSLIQETRKTLRVIPEKELAYILLTDMDNNNKDILINLGTNIGTPPALVSKETATLVPRMFTASVFSNVIKDQIPRAAEAVIKGNEVLGKKFTPANFMDSSASLIEELEKSYIEHYIATWETLVDNVSLNAPKSLAETDIMIQNLISSHSPLLQLLQTIHANTDIEPILSHSDKLRSLNTLFDQTQTKQKDSLYQIFVDLHQLHLFIQQAGEANVPVNAKLEDPSKHIRRTVEKYPEPIQHWLLALVSNTQNLLHADLKEQKPETAAISLPQPTDIQKEKKIQKKIVHDNQDLLEPSLIKQAVTHPPRGRGEYVKVLSGKHHPFIFVQKN